MILYFEIYLCTIYMFMIMNAWHSTIGFKSFTKCRLCHKVMCPFLQRWRKIKPGKDTTIELRDKLCNDFFEHVLAFKPE